MTSMKRTFILERRDWKPKMLSNAFVIHYFTNSLWRYVLFFKEDMPFLNLTSQFCPQVRLVCESAEVVLIFRLTKCYEKFHRRIFTAYLPKAIINFAKK